MSYPFLPVNPCCTDVVLNSPCGCTSTLPNTGCEQTQCGTNVILSSNVLYNGPVLDCIIAEPCDTLNVILQKIDEIICNLLTQINTLNIQVTNITGQIININSQIININNTLDVCCNVTTTTTTTATPTTTTTTTVVEECHYYILEGNIAPGVWIATLCGSKVDDPVYVGGELTPGQTEETPCIIPSTLELYGVSIKIDRGVCPTTTTTTTTL